MAGIGGRGVSPTPGSGRSRATTFALLNGRTPGVAVGTIHTAVPGQWSQNSATAFAVIEKLTGILGHFLPFGMTALRAGNSGIFFDDLAVHGIRLRVRGSLRKV